MEIGTPADAQRPNRIGPFQVLAQIGEGSFGVVFKAERREPVRQTVAIKVLRAGVATKEVLARFELERRALAAMNHRCIAKVLEAGATDRGEPWVAMELVEGLPLTTYCDKHRLSLKERIVLFQQVCDGVQHAHQKGVVHRDLKPGNVLVVREGEQHVPKILDFGLAKATHRDVFGGGSFATQKDMALGTLEYMSPEQAAGDGEAIDARSDVYSLGVMLYELLCGELPFPSAMLKAAGEMEARRVVVEQEPKKPSTKLLSRQDSEVLAAQRRSSLGMLKSALAGDLDWVVMKAMRKEPEGRYGAALALAADLGRYLVHEPLEAGPPSFGYRAQKFVRKYRVQCVAAAAVMLAIVAGGVGTAMGYADAREQERIATKRAEEIAALAEKDRIYADIARLQEAEARADAMWPAVPSRIPEYEQWLADVEPIVQRLPAVEAELARVRERARPVGADVRSAARKMAEAEVARLWAECDIAHARDRRALRQDIASAEVAAEAAGYDFSERADAERHLQLSKLASMIRACSRGGEILSRGPLASVRSRIDQAAYIKGVMAEHVHAWSSSIDAIAKSEKYGGMRLHVHEGLVPIGADPRSGLWEFVHLASGARGKEIPARDPATGNLVPTGEMGIVLVLLPGGTFWMGAQMEDKSRPNFDTNTGEDEGPVHEVMLSPYLVGKYEVTQGQWLRVAGGNPSDEASGGGIEPLRPVDTVTWFDCEEVARHLGLLLPSEAQWEYAYRGGASTPWWTGQSIDSLALGAVYGWDGDSGPSRSASVGSKAANPLGLFDVAGNVIEWCRDAWNGSRNYPSSSAADPLITSGPYRVYRGGSWLDNSSHCRAAYRSGNIPGLTVSSLGFRVVLAPVLVQ